MGYNTYLFYHPELDAVVAVEINKPHHSGRDAKQPRPSSWYARLLFSEARGRLPLENQC
jgi:hypothetical protein